MPWRAISSASANCGKNDRLRLVSGRFITVEGVEGVGKTTSIGFVAAHLRSAGVEVRTTREPGGTPLAERLREMLLHPGEPLGSEAELLLMFAARSVHLENAVRPALARGQWVVCDRFTDATRAYQGGGRGQPADRIEQLAAWVQRGLEPDLTILLDAPPEVTEVRRRHRGADDRFERESDRFHARVRNAYLQLARRWPQRIRLVDASDSPDQVHPRLADLLDSTVLKELSR